MSRRISTLACIAATTLAACGPTGLAFEPTAEARAAPAPALVETARFRASLAQAGPDAERLAAVSGGLAARADALAARAAALGGPVVDPALRPRLLPAARTPAAPDDQP